jgi:hypothetical protein
MYISHITHYDSDEMLWFTKIGTKDTLFYTVWGKTEAESRLRATLLLEMLDENVKEPM